MANIRQVEMICVHVHEDSIVDALREVADILDDPVYNKMVPMDAFISEPTGDCKPDSQVCVTILMAIPGTGKMIG